LEEKKPTKKGVVFSGMILLKEVNQVMDDWPVTVYVFEKEPFLGLENDDIPLEIKLIMWYQSLVVIILYIYYKHTCAK